MLPDEDDEEPEPPKYVAWTSAQNNNWTGKRRRKPEEEAKVQKTKRQSSIFRTSSATSLSEGGDSPKPALSRQKSIYLLGIGEELGTSQPPVTHPDLSSLLPTLRWCTLQRPKGPERFRNMAPGQKPWSRVVAARCVVLFSAAVPSE